MNDDKIERALCGAYDRALAEQHIKMLTVGNRVILRSPYNYSVRCKPLLRGIVSKPVAFDCHIGVCAYINFDPDNELWTRVAGFSRARDERLFNEDWSSIHLVEDRETIAKLAAEYAADQHEYYELLTGEIT